MDDSLAGEQTGFCDCWLGLRAGDCKDTAMSDDEGVVRYGTCGSGRLQLHSRDIIGFLIRLLTAINV